MKKLSQEQYNQLLQKGLNDTQVKNLAREKGFSLPGEKSGNLVKDIVVGAAKGFVGDIARPTAQLAQGLGQRAIAAVTPASLEQVQQQTGFKSLSDATPEGKAVVESLKTDSGGETAGRVAVNVASFFIPTSPAIQTAGRSLQSAGRVVTRAGIGLSAKEAPLVQAYKAKSGVGERILSALSGKNLNRPITNAETAVKQGLFGTESMIGVQAKRAADNIWGNVISPSLKQSPVRVNMSKFVDEIAQKVNEIPEITRKNELLQALSSFKDDYGKVGDVDLEKLQKFKEGWAKFLPDKVYKGKPISSSFKEIQNLAADLARNKIYKALENVEGKAAYFDYSNLKNLQEFGQKAMTGSKLKGGAGGFLTGLYDKVVTPVATTAGLTLYRTGEGLQFVGRTGAKILGDLFK